MIKKKIFFANHTSMYHLFSFKLTICFYIFLLSPFPVPTIIHLLSIFKSIKNEKGFSLFFLLIPAMGISKSNVVNTFRAFPKTENALEFKKAFASHAQKVPYRRL